MGDPPQSSPLTFNSGDPLLQLLGTTMENMADLMKKLHEEIKLKIEELNVKYKKDADQKRCSQSF